MSVCISHQRLLSRFTPMVAQFKTGSSIGLPINSISSHKEKFKAKNYLSYVGIIRCLSLESTLYFALVCLPISFMGEIVDNLENFGMNEVGRSKGLPRQPNSHL